MLPTIFIGCSSEGLPLAETIQRQLENHAEAKIWNQGIFPLSGSTLYSLIDASNNFDFGVFLFTPDDIAEMRGEKYLIARDNVLFELGLFIGKLGREKSFFIVPKLHPPIHLPSDLSGISSATYDTNKLDIQSAIAPVVYDIKQAITKSLSTKRTETRQGVSSLVVGTRLLLYSLRHSTSQTEILTDARSFIEKVIFPGRQIRVAFAKKTILNEQPVLQGIEPFPEFASHNVFSYPHTLASWALIEGKILAYPDDLNTQCDFEHLARLKKLSRVVDLLLSIEPKQDAVAEDFLNFDEIKDKTNSKTLALRDIYQHWVGRQPEAHYKHFISIPVPVVDRISNQFALPEYGVINIDTMEDIKLLNDQTRPLLKLASDMVALGFEKSK